jgi:hypothetical protein
MLISCPKLMLVTLGLALGSFATGTAAKDTENSAFEWEVVVNNSFEIPGNPGRYYNSYNPPSLNSGALVVFRARSTGQSQGPVSGIYTRDMWTLGPINKIADRDTEVPWPNNTEYPVPGGGGESIFSTFNEFPSFPRMAISADMVASRGNHKPVWTYAIPARRAAGHGGGEDDEGETRVGTTGVYVNLHAKQPLGELTTGASLLGATPDFWPIYQVPGADPGTRFDVFPGAPAITDRGIVAFKGNYTDDWDGGKTGVFYRQVTEGYAGGLEEPIHLIANSDTPVPNPGLCYNGTTFGSTAPPSAAGNHVVFSGFDNEWDPKCGGIYRTSLDLKKDPTEPAKLTTLVGLEEMVPGQGKKTFTQIGEGLSYDGRFVSFWGAWGKETKTVRLYCPQEGNKIRRDFCNHEGDFASGLGDGNSICDEDSDRCYQEKEVPVNQGMFVYDSVNKKLRMLARTGNGGTFDDFLYWNYSGAPPGAGEREGHAEPPRFRSAAFLAVSQRAGGTSRTVFLARNGELDGTNVYTDPVDGIYLASQLGAASPRLTTLLQTGMDGTLLDPEAVWDDGENQITPEVPLPIASLGLERDGFRGDWLAITASMGVEEAGWAGIYLIHMPNHPGR